MTPLKYEFHALANLFPLIEGTDFTGLVEDIRANGLRENIWLFDGKILDGRNRYRACGVGGYDVPSWQFSHFKPDQHGDPLAFVLSRNLHRRHLNESQRAMVAAKVANLRHGGARKADDQAANLPLEPERPSAAPVTQAEAAAVMQVGERSVRDAKKVLAQGSPELVRAVEQGDLAVSAAAQAVGLPAEQQADILRMAGEGKANAVRTVVKKGLRQAKEAALGEKQKALPAAKFGVIYADPEWRFKPYSEETGMDRAPENHYPTSTTEEIMARDVASIAADDCVLWLWATPPMIEHALAVMKAWGFIYRSQLVWNKVRTGQQRGPGYWFTGEHELLLLGTRGNVPAPAPGTQFRSSFDADVGEHSEKPEHAYLIIESYFPNLPKIELNARRSRPGWTAWGLEAPEEIPAGPPAGADHAGAGPDGDNGIDDARPIPDAVAGVSGPLPMEIPDLLRRAPVKIGGP